MEKELEVINQRSKLKIRILSYIWYWKTQIELKTVNFQMSQHIVLYINLDADFE